MTIAESRQTLLLGVDLEDVRLQVPDGERYADRVPAMTREYLAFFRRFGATTTFFTVGEVARRHPKLLREIADSGHEIACHTNTHSTLDRLTPAALREDLGRAHDAFEAAGVPRPVGFRAPTLSLTEKTSWAYEVLSEMGYEYSSSVLPAHNPLFGWPAFGKRPRRQSSVVELPVSVLPQVGLPFAAGTYLRALPTPLIALAARLHARNLGPAVGYVHPYDIDLEQERFMHPGINNSRFYNWLMYHNRHTVLPKLEALLNAGFEIKKYSTFVRSGM